MQTNQIILSSRQRAQGDNHHLWVNRNTWWFHGTFHKPDGTKERVRLTLKTRDLNRARALRDRLIRRYRPQAAAEPCAQAIA
jgi:hypothetical protein